MYIQVTINLHHYKKKTLDLRISDQHTAKKLIDIVWKLERLPQIDRREGGWVRIQNKKRMLSGSEVLADSGVSSGDHLEIL
ncbi:EsaB/YukD family protein [Bacillus sp. FSL W7-1360]